MSPGGMKYATQRSAGAGCGVIDATLMVNTSLPSMSPGSAMLTDWISVLAGPLVLSPAGSVMMPTPGSVQGVPTIGSAVTGSVMMLLPTLSPALLSAVTL